MYYEFYIILLFFLISKWNFNLGILPWTAWKTSKTSGTHSY